jgi:transcriptional regulator with XRE-family HTH domain
MPSKLFLERVGKIPEEVKRQNRLSMRIAYKIGKFLDDNSMTQRDFAELMNKKDSEISRWLSGKHNFTLETIAKIETTLKIQLLEVPMEMATNAISSKAETRVTPIINLDAENVKVVKVNIEKNLSQNVLKSFSETWKNKIFSGVLMVNEAIVQDVKDPIFTQSVELYEDIFYKKDEIVPVKANNSYLGPSFRTSSTSTCSLTK